jgi:sirohydrochlorin ferrochelatase
MFLTRSTCRPEPATEPSNRLVDAAVVLVGHGATDGEVQRAGLVGHAAALVRNEGLAEAHVAMLLGPGPRPSEVLGQITRRPAFVVPVMMCDGVATGRAVAACGAVADVRVYPPVGLHPRLTALIAERAAAAARRMRVQPAAAALLLIAHGSLRHPASADAAYRQAAALRTRRLFADVAVAFLAQPPHPAAALCRLPGPVVAVGLFVAPGHHATNDVPAAIAASGRVDVAYLGAIGADAAMASIIASMIADPPALPADTVR